MHHHYEMEGYRAHFPMFELSLQKQTYGKAYWQHCFNYPAVGVTAFYSPMGNIDVLGQALAHYEGYVYVNSTDILVALIDDYGSIYYNREVKILTDSITPTPVPNSRGVIEPYN